MDTNSAIGFFDSGVGGLSVWKEVVALLPGENTVYFADTLNCPYGVKSQKEVIALSSKVVDALLEKNVKIIVVACNTATAAAIDFLRENYKIEFVGMEPAVKPAALHSKSGKIGVLATKGTFEGRLFKETSQKWATDKDLIIQVGDGLVEIVENGMAQSKEAFILLERYLSPMLNKGVDQLVLGCTHYPFLIPVIRKIVGNQMEVVDPSPAVAKRVLDKLTEKSLLNTNNIKPYHNFISSGDTKVLDQMSACLMPVLQ